MFSVRKAISRASFALSMAYDFLELYVYCLLVFAWLFAVFFGFSAPCVSSNKQLDSVQEHFDIYDEVLEEMLEHIVVPHIRETIEEPSDVDESHEPYTSERLSIAPAAHETIHLEVPLVIENVSDQFCRFEFASNNGSNMSISSLSSIEIVDTPTPSPGGNRRGERDTSRDLNSSQLRPLLLSTQTIEPRNKRVPSLRVDAPAFVPAARASPPSQERRASGSENVPLPPSAYWNPPPNSALPVISVPYKRPRRRGGRTPVISEREIRERATRLGTKALQPVKI